MPIDITWEDTKQKPEETEFQKSKQTTLDEETKEELEEEQQEADRESRESVEEESKEYEPMGLAAMIGGVWNEVATPKGYEPLTDKQLDFLNTHTARLEEKHLKDKMLMMPEVEALLAHAVIYVPKWLKKKQEDAKKPK